MPSEKPRGHLRAACGAPCRERLDRVRRPGQASGWRPGGVRPGAASGCQTVFWGQKVLKSLSVAPRSPFCTQIAAFVDELVRMSWRKRPLKAAKCSKRPRDKLADGGGNGARLELWQQVPGAVDHFQDGAGDPGCQILPCRRRDHPVVATHDNCRRYRY